jgi:hypothetical protein
MSLNDGRFCKGKAMKHKEKRNSVAFLYAFLDKQSEIFAKQNAGR